MHTYISYILYYSVYFVLFLHKVKHLIAREIFLIKVEKDDFLKARQNIVPASHRVIVAPIKSLSFRIQPLLHEDLTGILSRLQTLCPAGMLTSDNM